LGDDLRSSRMGHAIRVITTNVKVVLTLASASQIDTISFKSLIYIVLPIGTVSDQVTRPFWRT